MEFAFETTATESAWREWDGSNFAVTDGAVEIAEAPHPSYVSPAELPADFEPADLARDECGDLYLLAPEGDVYRYDPVRESVDRLGCTWHADEAGRATAIAVTRRSLYVAGADGHLQAYARRLLQTRWTLTEPLSSPVALDASGGTVLVLDEGDGTDDSGFLATVGERGTVDRVVTGLSAPLDVATRGNTTSVLAGGDDQVLATYDAEFAETAAVSVPESLAATCLAVEPDGAVLVGVGEGAPALFRHRSGEFDRLDGLSEATSGLALSIGGARGRPDGLYAVAGDPGRAHFLERATTRRANPVTDRHDAQLVTRIDSGEPGTEWHRVTAEFDLAEAGSQVRLRYVATDDADLRYAEDSVALEAVDGIGSTYGDRLRGAGIRGLSELIEQSPETVARAVSTEVLDVSEERAEGWQDEGRRLLADRDGPVDLEAVDGIGPTFAGRLRDSGIDDVSALVDRTSAAVARIVSAGVYDIPPSRTASWIEHARQLLAERDDVRGVDWTTVDPPNPRDALLSGAEGRYLWVELELVGDRFATPRVGRFRAYFPRTSYLRHLPAVYREDPESAAFLERFLSIFESVFTDVDEEIESLTQYFDPAGAPSSALDWLGGWLGVDAGESWPEPARRKLVAHAPSLYKKRGTREGLGRILRLYLRHTAEYRDRFGEPPVDWTAATGPAAASAHRPGDPEAASTDGTETAGAEPVVYLFEHADLDCIDDPEVREAYERLIPCPQCFLVLVRSWVDDEALRTVDRIVDREQPAHAVGRAVRLRPWIQLGGNAYLGINTRLPEREFTVEEASLGRDSVLGSLEPDGRLGIRARVGTDTTIS